MIGLTFKGIHSSIFKIGLKSVDRSLLPQLRSTALTIPGRHGTINFSNGTYENRPITTEIYLAENQTWVDLREKARDVAQWLSGTGLLIFDDEPDKYYIATVKEYIGVEQYHLMPVGKSSVVFDCQPFAYMSSDLHADDSWDEADYSWNVDIAWDNAGLYSFSVVGNKSFSFNNPGTTDIDYFSPSEGKSIIIINGSWTTINIELNGKSLSYLVAGSGEITIDNIQMEVKRNGNNILGYIGGDIDNFLPIKPGNNLIKITGTGVNVSVKLDFVPQWI